MTVSLAQRSAPVHRAWLEARRSFMKSKSFETPETSCQVYASDKCRANGVAVRSLHFLPEVSQQRVEKVAGMVVLCIACRDLTDVWIHYAANGFGAEQLSAVRPLLQQRIGYIVGRSEHPQKGMFGLGLMVVMSLRRIESE
jgi:hypothetical protein